MLRIWNSLPEEVVSADHLSLFIRRLERVRLDQFLIGKIHMLLCVLFYISRSDYYLYLVNLIPALRLAIAPEFFLLLLYARILYVHSGMLK